MKNKLLSTAFLYTIVYLLPLVGHIRLVWTVQVGLLALISAIIIFTQPPLSISESNATRQNDRSSTWVIALGYVVSQASSVIEWAYFRPDFHAFSIDLFVLLGLVLMIGGILFRLWSIRLLGQYFTATVQTQANQQIIKIGAYRFIRHPSYLGAYLFVVGSAVLLHAYISIALSAVLMFSAYWYRIKVEEETLVQEFGKAYREYQSQTKKLFPAIY